MNRGDIYLVSLDPTVGHEQRGHRPALVISPTAFNEATKLPVVLPITSGGDFARRIGFAVPSQGTRTTGVVRCDQPRVLYKETKSVSRTKQKDNGKGCFIPRGSATPVGDYIHARMGQKIDTLPAEILDEVLARTATLFA